MLRHISTPTEAGGVFNDGIPRAATLGSYTTQEVCVRARACVRVFGCRHCAFRTFAACPSASTRILGSHPASVPEPRTQ